MSTALRCSFSFHRRHGPLAVSTKFQNLAAKELGPSALSSTVAQASDREVACYLVQTALNTSAFHSDTHAMRPQADAVAAGLNIDRTPTRNPSGHLGKFKMALRHRDVPAFSSAQALENTAKRKLHFSLCVLKNPRDGVFQGPGKSRAIVGSGSTKARPTRTEGLAPAFKM